MQNRIIWFIKNTITNNKDLTYFYRLTSAPKIKSLVIIK